MTDQTFATLDEAFDALRVQLGETLTKANTEQAENACRGFHTWLEETLQMDAKARMDIPSHEMFGLMRRFVREKGDHFAAGLRMCDNSRWQHPDYDKIRKDSEYDAKVQCESALLKVRTKLFADAPVEVERASLTAYGDMTVYGEVNGHTVELRQSRKIVYGRYMPRRGGFTRPYAQFPALLYVDGKRTVAAQFKAAVA